MPQRCIMKMGKGYDNTISCTVVVSVSASHSRCSCLVSYTSPPIQKQRSRSDATSEPYKPTFLATRLMVVLQPPGYSVFHDGVTPVSVSTLKPPLGAIGVVNTETPSISYIISLYIRLVVTL